MCEWELKLDEITKDCSEEYKNKINTEIKNVLKTEMKYTYNEFNDKFEDFKYKYQEVSEKAFQKVSTYKQV